jgi:uncharacterized protein YoxC
MAKTLPELVVPISGDTKKFEDSMDKVKKTVGETNNSFGSKIKEVGSNLDQLSKQVTGFSMAEIATVGTAAKLLQEGVKFAKDSIAEYSAYVDQISIMAAYTSTSTEEMSKLYQITDDLRIPIGNLEMALKTMTDKGTAPSIEGIKELSDKYLSLESPLERAQFLTDNFGRAGQDMARLMEMGGDSIQNASDEIANWMVVTGESEEVVKEYLATLDTWGEAMDEIKFRFAQNVTPAITNFMNAVLKTNEIVNDGNKKWYDWIPQVRAIETLFVSIKAILDAFNGKLDNTTDSVVDQTNAANDLKNAWDNVNNSVNSYSNNTTRGSIYDRPNYGSIYGTGHAGGGSFVVPEGFQNDSFYLGAGHFAQSGEIITISPKNQTEKVSNLSNQKIENLLEQLVNKPTITKNDLITANRELINKNLN